ncbi:uncharacterized protein FSUBG_13493 [Fusarium subglutinans]|uniref:Uncharacterized protein n=1 Tax=Gibberella subglutinans TaxID=42677 RepID=A0A8H5KVP1_GIBSU|nr:uncharacterized protein FSUBG_13493 [Fusarium subglutinans]KAF5580054.1 hypothetical protein FSUBG_13493 [Fusarium subglutinans]
MAKKKSCKDFKCLSTKSDSHWQTPPSEAQKSNPIEESRVAQDTDEMNSFEEPAAKRRALGSGKLNARSFEYRDLQIRRRRPTESQRPAESHSDSFTKVQSTCSRGRGQDRDRAPHCGGSHHGFQVRVRDLSPVEDDVEMEDDDLPSDNPAASRTAQTNWMSQEEANAAVSCLGPLDTIP